MVLGKRARRELFKGLEGKLVTDSEFSAKGILTAYAIDGSIIERGEVTFVMDGPKMVNAVTITSDPVNRPFIIGMVSVKIGGELLEDWSTNSGVTMGKGDILAFRRGDIIINL